MARRPMVDSGVMAILGDLIEPGSTSGSQPQDSQLSPRAWNPAATRIGIKTASWPAPAVSSRGDGSQNIGAK